MIYGFIVGLHYVLCGSAHDEDEEIKGKCMMATQQSF